MSFIRCFVLLQDEYNRLREKHDVLAAQLKKKEKEVQDLQKKVQRIEGNTHLWSPMKYGR